MIKGLSLYLCRSTKKYGDGEYWFGFKEWKSGFEYGIDFDWWVCAIIGLSLYL